MYQKFSVVVKSIRHPQCPCLHPAGWTLHGPSSGTPMRDPCLSVRDAEPCSVDRGPVPSPDQRQVREPVWAHRLGSGWEGPEPPKSLQNSGEAWAGAGSEAVWGSPVPDTAQRRASRRASPSRSWEQPSSRGPSLLWLDLVLPGKSLGFFMKCFIFCSKGCCRKAIC